MLMSNLFYISAPRKIVSKRHALNTLLPLLQNEMIPHGIWFDISTGGAVQSQNPISNLGLDLDAHSGPTGI